MTLQDLKMTTVRLCGSSGQGAVVRRNRALSALGPLTAGTEVPIFDGSVTRVPAASLQGRMHPTRQIGHLR